MTVVTTGVHYGRDETPDLDIAPIDGGRWMVGVGSDCTIYGTASQLRMLAEQLLEQVPAPSPGPQAPFAAALAEAMATVDQGVAR